MKEGCAVKKPLTIARAFLFACLIVIAFVFLVPFLWTVLTSLKLDKEIYSSRMIILPSRITLTHYVRVLTQMKEVINFFVNTVSITLWSVGGTMLLSAMMGYAFGKLTFFGKNVYLLFVMIILTLPYAIYLIPIYIMENRLGLVNTHPGLILPYIAINLPMSIFVMRGIFINIPNEIAESGMIDGCNFYQIWSKIMLPLARPGLAVVMIFTFINVWGEFMFARTLSSSPAAQTLAVGITFLRDEASSWQYGTLCSVITLSLIPLLAVFLSMQKYFIEKGLMEGALKG